MVCSNLHQLLNTEFNITYLSSTSADKSSEKLSKYICTKGMRPFSRLFYIISGETFFTFTNKAKEEITVHAKKHDIVFLPDDIEYTSYWKNIDDMDYVSVKFLLKGTRNEQILVNEEICIIAKDTDELLLPYFTEINTQWSNGLLGYKLKCKSLIFNLIEQIATENIRRESREVPNSVYKGIVYIENHYLEDISVYKLAKMSNMCETNFRKIFKAQINMSPIEYKNYLRIKKAAELMKTGSYTATEAAHAVSIDDIYYFSKLFKRQYGISPRKYIMQLRNGEFSE